MEIAKLKKFAQFARRSLIEQVSAKLNMVLTENHAARRENASAVKKLEESIKLQGREQVVEQVAYIWFNRFCALRFMDVNRYTRIGVVSPAEGQFQPEILAEVKMGHIDEEMVSDKVRQQVFALLNGKTPSRDPQGEAYRLLVVAACNFWNKAMPFLFQRIDDYTELLMPDDLLSGNSILAYTREAMTPDACQDVEVIGWLYQFYISEKKDEVFDGLKKNKKITPANIPAATQLFTPHWIVRYLVENSLGRLWMINHPGSKLIEKMDYYIKSEQPETDFLRIDKPEEIKICDPACGSGHMLTYAFDLLYAIYEEEAYEPAEIPEKILTYNLYGIEIDERAGELAAFALTMKARAKQRRFFRKPLLPNICVLEKLQIDKNELENYIEFIGLDKFTASIQKVLQSFIEADNFGSLLLPNVNELNRLIKILEAKDVPGDLFIALTHRKVIRSLQQADYLRAKYNIIIANPPYMGGRNMNGRLGAWAKDNYPDSKADLFAMFIERNLSLVQQRGMVAMVTMQSWMFIGSFQALREKILSNHRILNLTQIGFNSFPALNSKYALACAFIILNNQSDKPGAYINLNDAPRSADKEKVFYEKIANHEIFYLSSKDFFSIPGAPIAFWASDDMRSVFKRSKTLSQVADIRQGLATCNNDLFIRLWHEVSLKKIGFGIENAESAAVSWFKWFPYNKGGGYRKWYGNNEYVVNWEDNGRDIHAYSNLPMDYSGAPVRAKQYYFQEGITYGLISLFFSSRRVCKGFIFDVGGSMIFPTTEINISKLQAFLSSKLVNFFLGMLNPTLNYQVGDVQRLPIDGNAFSKLKGNWDRPVQISKLDWDSFENSWEFTSNPLLENSKHSKLETAYSELKKIWKSMTDELFNIEIDNNKLFAESYGVTKSIDPEIEIKDITVNCNPHYRYGGGKSEDELEALLLSDTMRELISYAVGCMFGRYALELPGLILANQGETIEDYLKRLPKPGFPADDDNVIPMLDGDWFADDIAERFRKFIRVAFGEEHYESNLKFVEKAIGKNGKSRSIRDYFLKDFYNDHVKRYKKRPIYWLFSSPKGSFNALIYMHRYRPDTVSVVLNDYLREFRTKLTAHKSHLEAVSISAGASQGEKTKALKEIERVNKMIAETGEYEREVLYPLATKQVEIDLDDGVKVNYPKLGAALKKIPGLEAKED